MESFGMEGLGSTALRVCGIVLEDSPDPSLTPGLELHSHCTLASHPHHRRIRALTHLPRRVRGLKSREVPSLNQADFCGDGRRTLSLNLSQHLGLVCCVDIPLLTPVSCTAHQFSFQMPWKKSPSNICFSILLCLHHKVGQGSFSLSLHGPVTLVLGLQVKARDTARYH